MTDKKREKLKNMDIKKAIGLYSEKKMTYKDLQQHKDFIFLHGKHKLSIIIEEASRRNYE